MTVTCPGKVTEMTPPHMHINFELSLTLGIFLTNTNGFPGVHGVVVLGTQGIGVSTPIAADVADATVGLARDMHTPKGGILTIGLLSIMFAMGTFEAIIILSGNTFKVLGAAPKGHIINPPVQSAIPIFYSFIKIIPATLPQWQYSLRC